MNTRRNRRRIIRPDWGSGALTRIGVAVFLIALPALAGEGPRRQNIASDIVPRLQPTPAAQPADSGGMTPAEIPRRADPVIPIATAQALPVNLDWYVIDYGGGTSVGTGNVWTGLSVGQNAVGEVAAGNLRMELGFWYGAASAAAPCACDCHGDPLCDGVTTVHDVVFAAGVAFRGEAEIPDSNVLCPRMTTDVDCDGVTKIHDVVHLVNVAFRSADPATEFCEPCGM
ncbi:MAG: hypothetical protein AB1792_07650 [Candidatus Zixiibacteriota bacterium]